MPITFPTEVCTVYFAWRIYLDYIYDINLLLRGKKLDTLSPLLTLRAIISNFFQIFVHPVAV